MSTWDLVKTRINEGLDLQVGRHAEVRGFWACFVKNVFSHNCPRCDEPPIEPWDKAGHAMEIEDAIRIADKIQQGIMVQACDVDDFI